MEIPDIFEFSIKTDEPYFGQLLYAGQCSNETRREIMVSVLEYEMRTNQREDFRLLEIGSWAGQSTSLWASVMKKFGRGKVYCIDTWKGSDSYPYFKDKAKEIMNLFWHNIWAGGFDDYIVAIRGSSDELASILKPESFDIVFIDGDHAYTQFKRDLLNYKEFVKIGGIICGDDAGYGIRDIDSKFATEHREEDTVTEELTGKKYHPGIILGLHELLSGKIVDRYGFWSTRRTKNEWKPNYGIEEDNPKI